MEAAVLKKQGFITLILSMFLFQYQVFVVHGMVGGLRTKSKGLEHAMSTPQLNTGAHVPLTRSISSIEIATTPHPVPKRSSSTTALMPTNPKHSALPNVIAQDSINKVTRTSPQRRANEPLVAAGPGRPPLHPGAPRAFTDPHAKRPRTWPVPPFSSTTRTMTGGIRRK